jgi:hypothetical protein
MTRGSPRLPGNAPRAATALVRRGLAALVALLILALPGVASAGYTHYWKWKARPDPAELARCVDEMLKLADARRDILEDANGRSGGPAEFRTTCSFADAGVLPCVNFNGIGDDAHETFAFPLASFAGTPELSFVKTAYKPYDEVVVASLIVARDHFAPASLEIFSDGQWLDDWTAGAALYERVLRRPARNPLNVWSGASPSPADDEPPPGPTPSAWSPRKKAIAVVIALLLTAVLVLLSRK